MRTTRITRPAALLTLVAALLGLLAGLTGQAGQASAADAAVSSADDDVTLTFDWPLGCDVVVAQDNANGPGETASSVSYTLRLDEGGTPGNLLVTFGDAELVELRDSHGEPGELDAGSTSAYMTNPTIEIDRSGIPVAYAYEEWAEARLDSPDAFEDAFALMPPVEHRVGVATWPTWVSLWTQLGAVDTNGADAAATVSLVNEDGSTIDVDLTASAESQADGSVGLFANWQLGAVSAQILVITDPATLQPIVATFEYSLRESDRVIDRYDWSFDWSACDGAPTVAELPPPPTTAPSTTTSTTAPAITAVTVPGFGTVHVDDLPDEAHDTLALIADGGPFPYRQDGVVFENREGLLPDRQYGYYREYTVETPGASTRGAKRIVTGDGGEMFYTDDHYDSFRVIVY